MNRGVIESSPVQHLTVAQNPNWGNNGGLRPPPPQLPPSTTTTTYLLPSFCPSSSPSLPLTSNPNFSSWLDNSYDLSLDQPWSLCQLLLGGLMMGDEERMEIMNYQQHSYQEKKLENWEEQVLRHQASMNQESNNSNGYVIMSSPNSPLNSNDNT